MDSTGAGTERAWQLIFVTALIVTCAYAYIFSISPLTGEDFALTKDFGSAALTDRLHWVATRSAQQITGWNARLGEQLAILWLSLPRAWFVVAQTLALGVLCFLSSTLIDTAEWKKKTLIAATLIFALWPRLETFFWSTAAAEYLQPLLLCLVVVRAYASAAALDDLVRSRFGWTAIAAAAFFAGLSFENTPLAMLPFMAVAVALDRKRHLRARTVLPAVTLVMGWLTLMLAPSTQIRRAYYAGVFDVHGYTFAYLATRAVNVAYVFLASAWPLILIGLASVGYLSRDARDRQRLAFLAGLAILAVGSAVPAPYTEPRAFILAWAVMFSACTAAVARATTAFRLGTVIYATAAALMLIAPYVALQQYSYFAVRSIRLDDRIRAARQTSACMQGIEVDPVETRFPKRLLTNRSDWYRANPEQVGAYYGCKILIRQQ